MPQLPPPYYTYSTHRTCQEHMGKVMRTPSTLSSVLISKGIRCELQQRDSQETLGKAGETVEREVVSATVKLPFSYQGDCYV